ncbi:MAG: hypothetical protein L5655_04690 [Thermosediminibacteraceae bacterium]|nr:hypothetical protein [Thermosediminibacteraceae bacterium]
MIRSAQYHLNVIVKCGFGFTRTRHSIPDPEAVVGLDIPPEADLLMNFSISSIIILLEKWIRHNQFEGPFGGWWILWMINIPTILCQMN